MAPKQYRGTPQRKKKVLPQKGPSIAVSNSKITRDPLRGQTYQDIIFYGDDNALPQRIRYFSAKNAMAGRCLELFADGVAGQGLQTTAKDNIINFVTQESLEDLHRHICPDIAMFSSYAVIVHYGPDGRGEHYELVPAQNVRKRFDGTFAVWDNWGGERSGDPDRGGQPTLYLAFHNNQKLVKEEIKFYESQGYPHPGHCYFAEFWDGAKATYPTPRLNRALLQMSTAWAAWRVQDGLVHGGMTQGRVVYVPGTNGDISGYAKEIDKMTGPDAAGGTLVIQGDGGQGQFKIESLTDSNVDGVLERTITGINREVRVAMGIHPALVEISTGLADTEIELAYKLLNLNTDKARKFVAASLDYLFSNSIYNFTRADFEVLPLDITLTKNNNGNAAN